MNGFEGHGFGMGWGWIIGLFILIAVIWLLINAINQNRGTNRRIEKPAAEILKERYAKGEISKEEFESKMRDLNKY